MWNKRTRQRKIVGRLNSLKNTLITNIIRKLSPLLRGRIRIRKLSPLLIRIFTLYAIGFLKFYKESESESKQARVKNKKNKGTPPAYAALSILNKSSKKKIKTNNNLHPEGTREILKYRIWKKVIRNLVKRLYYFTSRKKYLTDQSVDPKDTQTYVIRDNKSTIKDKEYDETMVQSTFKKTMFGIALVQKNIENLLRKRRRIRGLIHGRAQLAVSLKRDHKRGFRKQSSLFKPHLNDLIKLLSDILCTEVELEIVQLKYPYHDSNIFAQYLGLKARKLTYGRIKNKIIKKNTRIFI